MKQSTNNATRSRKAVASSNGSSKTQHKNGSRQQANAAEKNNQRGNSGASDNSRTSSASSKNAASENSTRQDASREGSSRKSADQQGAGHQGSFTGKSHLEKFFLDQLKDIYYAEQKIVQSLPKMQEAATTHELKDAFEDHLHQTQRHVRRLEKVFETLSQKAEGKKCEAIEGISREVENIISETEEGTLTRDAALIIAAQKVEHYEIATYGGLLQLAITMQLHDAADLLDKTLIEEEDTDARLTEIAESEINLRAEHEDDQQGRHSSSETEDENEDGEQGDRDEEGSSLD